MMSRLVPHYSKVNKVAFLCCDLQQRFSTIVPKFGQCVNVANRFAAATAVFPNATYIVTEHVPDKLGATVPEITIPVKNSLVIPKVEFSMVPSLQHNSTHGDVIADKDVIVLFGIEAHVCVLQTVGDVLEQYPDKTIVLAVDGIGSTNSYDEVAAYRYFDGIQSMSNGKFLMLSSESILFQLTRTAKDPCFRGVSAISKNFPMPKLV